MLNKKRALPFLLIALLSTPTQSNAVIKDLPAAATAMGCLMGINIMRNYEDTVPLRALVDTGIGLALGLWCGDSIEYPEPNTAQIPATQASLALGMAPALLTNLFKKEPSCMPSAFYTGFLLSASSPQSTPAQLKKSAPVNYSFNRLAGEIPQEVREVVDFIKEADTYKKVGAHMPSGILLSGPPGTGKTSIARAIAGEVDAYFVAASGTEFIEQYVGVGASRVRELFKEARTAVKEQGYAKAIIFIDEIDAIAGKRSLSFGGGSDEYRQTLNELLNQLDGFQEDSSVFVIGATNTPDLLDPALTRSGRFDRHVTIRLPNEKSREAILRLYARSITHAPNVNFKLLAKKTDRLTGADLKNLVNEAAIIAVRNKKSIVTQNHFEYVLTTNEKFRKF